MSVIEDIEKRKFNHNGVERWTEQEMYLLFDYYDYLTFDDVVERSKQTLKGEDIELHYLTTYNSNGRNIYLSREALYAIILEMHSKNEYIEQVKNEIINRAFN